MFNVDHWKEKLFGTELTIIILNHEDENRVFLVGVELARFLKRKTFNVYRCMKKKGITVRRAEPHEISSLIKCGAVRPGSPSVSLIEFQRGVCFLAECLCQEQNSSSASVAAAVASALDKVNRHRDPSLSPKQNEGADDILAHSKLAATRRRGRRRRRSTATRSSLRVSKPSSNHRRTPSVSEVTPRSPHRTALMLSKWKHSRRKALPWNVHRSIPKDWKKKPQYHAHTVIDMFEEKQPASSPPPAPSMDMASSCESSPTRPSLVDYVSPSRSRPPIARRTRSRSAKANASPVRSTRRPRSNTSPSTLLNIVGPSRTPERDVKNHHDEMKDDELQPVKSLVSGGGPSFTSITSS